MQAITLEVILRAVFGVRDGERMDLFRERIPPLGETASVFNDLPFMKRDLGGITPAARFRRALAAVDELIYAEIAERRAARGRRGRDDVLSLLLGARHEDGSPMTDTELRDELMTLLTAGPRDDGDRTGVGVRAAAADAARARAPDELARRRRVPGRRGEGDAARTAGGGRRRAQAHARDRDRRLAAARRHAGAAGDRGDAPAAGPVRRARGVQARALPRRRAPSRTPGSRSAAACGAASARRSRRSRCAPCCARSCAACG